VNGALATIVFDFDPYLVIGDRAVRWETLGVAAAVLLGLVAIALAAGRPPAAPAPEPPAAGLAAQAATRRLRRDDLLFIVLGAVPGAVILGRAGYGLLHADYYAASWRALLDPAQGSLELGLGVVGGTLTAAYVAALLDAPLGRWLGVAIGPLLLVLGLGKVAQAFGGSGQGASFDGPWATAYLPPGPWGSPGAELPAHPAQLYEAGATLAALAVLALLARTGPLRRSDGRLFVAGLGLWAAGRAAAAAAWRDAPVAGPLNAGQLLAGAIALGCAALLAAAALRPRLARGRYASRA